MAKIAILPVRFQNSYLHAGHKNLIDFAQDENDMVLIVLGTNPTRLTVDNPLSFDMRKEMIQTEYQINIPYDRKTPKSTISC